MNCDCCKNFLNPISIFKDGNLLYCLSCVKSKEIDKDLHELYKIDWEYCEYCKNLVLLSDFHGSCQSQKNCKINFKFGFSHLCKDCIKNNNCLLCN
jgi:hypothetical protein